MNRVGEYIRFAVCFSGVGYLVLWPLTAHGDGFAALGLSFVCGQPFALAEFVCGSRPALHLSPGLHLAGMMSSTCVLICLVLRPLRRWRGRAAGERAPTPRRYVRPRSHFGLRGAPR